MHSHEYEHFEAIYKILRYLKGSPSRELMFKKRCHLKDVYTDIDWEESTIDRQSTSGYYTLIGGNLVT